MLKPTDRAIVLGVSVDARTAQAVNDVLRKITPATRKRLRGTQGSPSGYSKSGGTHDGQGVLDVVIDGGTDADYTALARAFRRGGFAAWYRPAGWDGADGIAHLHAVLIGHPDLSPAAKAQTSAYARKTNGLKNDAPDTLQYHPTYRYQWREPYTRRRVTLSRDSRPELRAVGRTKPSHKAPVATDKNGRPVLIRNRQVLDARPVAGHPNWSETRRGTRFPTRILPPA